MSEPTVTMHEEKQTGTHLLMAGFVSVFGVLLTAASIVMEWEMWMIPLIVIGILVIWSLHIGRMASDSIYEYVCAGIMMVEIFYYGTHAECLYDVPMSVCMLLFMLALLDKKLLLYLSGAMYLMVLLYHIFFLGTIGPGMGMENFVRLGIGAAGTVGAMALSCSMVNRWKEERKEMLEMTGMLETAKRQNADFLSNVSHELRTPINMVTGISEVALGRQIPPDLRESMRSVQMAGRRLAGQINDILDYTEIVGNTLVVTNENYMPSSVINDVITTAAMQNSEHKLELIFDLEPQVPAVLIGDAEKISRVLRILLQNAMKFTEEGGIYVHVGHRRESYGVNLDITICDTGIGMTPGQLCRIYDDFYQADSGRSRYAGGLGLGIPIARGLLHAMEGFIHYSSKENQGTQVHISIPQGVAEDTPGMLLSDAKQFCIVCYFKQDKYSRGEVRLYYDNLILHMAEGLGIQAYRAYHFVDLERVLNSHRLTHLFLSQEEYRENISYFEELGKTICVVLIADKDFFPDVGSRMILIHKPFFALPIVNLLNGVTHGNDLWESMMEDREFTCAGVRALVVDDEEMNLVVARGILDSYGIRIDTCLSGAAAVEQCVGTMYDLIFLDHMMPGMDGVETLKRIRAMKEGMYQNLPIIALTANAISGAREMFKSEGFTEFVPKPIERSVLERVLRRVLPEQCIRYHGGSMQGAQSAGRGTAAGPSALLADGRGASQSAKQRRVLQAGQGDLSGEEAFPEAAQETSEPRGMLERLEQIGIRVETGLSYCGGEKDFYLEMLQMYCDQSEAKRREIVELYQREEWEEYAVKVHALKSTSLTIGAEELSAKAKALELAGKSGDIAFIRENHEQLMEAYEAVCRFIVENVAMEGRGLRFK